MKAIWIFYCVPGIPVWSPQVGGHLAAAAAAAAAATTTTTTTTTTTPV